MLLCYHVTMVLRLKNDTVRYWLSDKVVFELGTVQTSAYNHKH